MGQDSQLGVASWQAGQWLQQSVTVSPREAWTVCYGNKEDSIVTKQVTCALGLRFEE